MNRTAIAALFLVIFLAAAVQTTAAASAPAKPASKTSSKKEPRVFNVWIWQETEDCLWNIAKKYYGDPHKWRIIYEANRDKISNPSVIYPRQKLVIPYIIDESIAK